MKNTRLLVLTVLLVSGCASMALEKEFKERGYSEKDRQTISEYKNQYNKQLLLLDSGRTSETAKVEAEKLVRKVWCNCYKKLNDRCRQKPDGLRGNDYTLWAKGNGAELALRTANESPNPMALDEAQCDL
ncbi:hypothetical protein K2X30_11575 [bacterium]|jgi:uncharacterized protein YceK|nr:hypothetical protein [bacterium]